MSIEENLLMGALVAIVAILLVVPFVRSRAQKADDRAKAKRVRVKKRRARRVKGRRKSMTKPLEIPMRDNNFPVLLDNGRPEYVMQEVKPVVRTPRIPYRRTGC